MVILAAALAIGCIAAGIALVLTLPKMIIIFLGLGLVALGVSVFFFLIKFIFAVSKDENDLRVEITESEQPNSSEKNFPFTSGQRLCFLQLQLLEFVLSG